MAAIAELNEQIRAYDRQIDKLIDDKYPEAAHLCKVGGVGPITGLTYVLTVENPGRFHRSRDVGRIWGSRAGGARAATWTPRSGSPRQAMDSCGACWCSVRSTSWVRWVRTARCDAGACS